MSRAANFALIGAAGYVAPRHLEAIQATGHRLVAALDPFDSVGILDRYFPEAAFFTEFERFDRHLEKLQRQGVGVDYLSVCSPNYLHDAHVRFGLRLGADVICEKPLVLNPWNVTALAEKEAETRGKIYTILQLRLHPAVRALRESVNAAPERVWDVDLTYITARGHWYYSSWKGDESKSGGIATNIGIHLFDMLIWVFGPVRRSEVHARSHDRVAGFLELEHARVRWFLSIGAATLPESVRQRGEHSYRALRIGADEFDFSAGFEALHTRSYAAILDGQGFGIEAARPAVELAYQIRTVELIGRNVRSHELAGLPPVPHPFASGRGNG